MDISRILFLFQLSEFVKDFVLNIFPTLCWYLIIIIGTRYIVPYKGIFYFIFRSSVFSTCNISRSWYKTNLRMCWFIGYLSHFTFYFYKKKLAVFSIFYRWWVFKLTKILLICCQRWQNRHQKCVSKENTYHENGYNNLFQMVYNRNWGISNII